MFFSASIAITFVLSLSGIAVRSAPLAAREDFVPQACTGTKGSGTCTPIKVGDVTADACTNVSNVRSLKMNVDNDCVSFPLPNCTFDFADSNSFASEHFSNDSDDLSATTIQSITCQAVPGLVNGLFPHLTNSTKPTKLVISKLSIDLIIATLSGGARHLQSIIFANSSSGCLNFFGRDSGAQHAYGRLLSQPYLHLANSHAKFNCSSSTVSALLVLVYEQLVQSSFDRPRADNALPDVPTDDLGRLRGSVDAWR
ncbi:hypothetical protein B0H15DRAFT_796526 [Mycena belliarum]|uniref:Uncharacterized protein n=1 Tax=Mycena belliarum TaxID=1033014 RepID=A0AAD6UHS7_9AGAR|nr:hypothetical protein B0H15DRAFT_796526 [Mycena belliae]